MVLANKSKPPTTIQHKKRSGQHHKPTKHYAKTYWPYLPLLLIVGVGLLGNMAWSHRSNNVLGATTLSSVSLLNDTNTQRTSDGESALRINALLDTAAQAKASDMAQRNYWSHDTPDGATPWTFITKVGYNYQSAGENLAYGFTDSSAIISGWMNSAEHRANILNPSFREVGFGTATAANYQGSGPQTIVVAMYAQPVTITTSSSVRSSPISSGSSIASSVGITSPSRTEIQPPAQSIARIQVLTAGNAPWSLFIVSVTSAIAILWFVVRHGLVWRKVLVRSEAFVVDHKLLDAVFISIATLGFILSRTAGFIH